MPPGFPNRSFPASKPDSGFSVEAGKIGKPRNKTGGDAEIRFLFASTTSLTACFVGSFGSVAMAGQNDLWFPSISTSVTTSEQQTLGSLELFMPVLQSDDSVFFVDLRLDPEHLADFRGSYGSGVRHIVNNELMVGGYGYFNNEVFMGTPFQGVTIGAEFVTPHWDGHLNYHFSLDNPVGSGAGGGAPVLSLAGNNLVALIDSTALVPMDGVDAELGYTINNGLGEGNSVRASGGVYHYFSNDLDFSFTGVKAGLEIEHKFGNSAYAPTLSFGGEVRHDNVNKTGYSVQARLRIPLGGDGLFSNGEAIPDGEGDISTDGYLPNAGNTNSGLTKDRINQRVRATGIVTVQRGSQSQATVIDAATNNAIGQFFFADDANTAGAGTFADPTTLDSAITNAGVAGYVVALESGLAGDINTSGATLLANQSVVGGGSGVAVLVNGSPMTFTVPGAAGTINGTGAGTDILTLADDNLIRNVTLTGGNHGISGDGIANGIIDNVTLVSNGADSIRFENTTGIQTISNFSITGSGDDGIFLEGAAQVNISDGSVDGTADQGIDLRETNASISAVTIGANSAIGNEGLLIENSDATDRTVTVNNVTIGSATAGTTGNIGSNALSVESSGSGKLSLNMMGSNILRSTSTAMLTVTGGTADSLEIAFGDLQAETGTLVPAVDIQGTLINPTTSSTVVRSAGAITVTGNGTGGGIRFNNTRFDADAGTAGNQQVAFGTMNIGQGAGAAQRVQGDGLSFLSPIGDLQISTLNIFNDLGTGLEVDTKIGGTTFNLDVDGGAVNTTNGAALFLDPLTGNINLASVTSTGATALGPSSQVSSGNGMGIFIDGLTSLNANPALNIGTVTITGPATSGIGIQDSSGLTFGTVDITLSEANSQGVDFAGTSGDVSFGATTIEGVGSAAGQTGIDFSGATLDGSVIFDSVSITGPTTSTDSIGVDLTGLQGNQMVSLGSSATPASGPSSSITGVHRGVVIDPTAAVQFRFGDGESGSDAGSSIDVNGQAGAFTVDAGGGTLPASMFDFDDVAFGAGDEANFPIAANAVVFVSTAGGTVTAGTNGLSADVSTITVTAAIAEADTDQTFVFVGDAGGVIDVVAGGTNGFVLDAGQRIDSFNDGNTITFGTVQPTNITGNFGVTGGSITANDVTAQNSTAGATAVITGTAGNSVNNIDITVGATSGAGVALSGTSTAATLDNIGISGGGAYGITVTGNSAAITLMDVDISGMGMGIREQLGTGAGSISADAASSITNTTTRAIDISQSAADFSYGGTISETDASGAGISIDQLSGTALFSGSVALDTGNANGVNLTNNAGGNIIFTGGLDIDTTTGTGFTASGGGTIGIINTATERITTIGTGRALNLDGITVGGGGINFDSVATSAGTTSSGVDINDVVGDTITLTSVNLNGIAATTGLVVSGNSRSSDVVVTGGTITNGVVISDEGSGTVEIGANIFEISGYAFQAANRTATSGDITVGGTITSATGAVSIQSNSGGDITFNGGVTGTGANTTGAITIGSTTGGTVTFAGLVDIDVTGSGKGVAIANTNAGGTFDFTGGLDINSVNGTAFEALSGTVSVANAGTEQITTTGTAGALNLDGITVGGGGINFDSVATSAGTTSSGVDINDVVGDTITLTSVNLNGIAATTGLVVSGNSRSSDVVVTGGTITNGVVISGQGSGTVEIGANIFEISGYAFQAANRTATSGDITVGGTITSATGAVSIQSNTGGDITFNGGITGTGANTTGAITIGSTTGGTITFAGLVDIDVTGSGKGVAIANTNAGGTFDFTGGLDINSVNGTAFEALSGTVSVANAGTEQITTTGTAGALNLDGMTVGGGGINFDSVTTSGTTGGASVSLANLAGTGSLMVTSTSLEIGATTSGIQLSGTIGAGLNFGDVDIALTGDNATAFDASGATLNGTVSASDFDVTSSSATGTTGIDITGTTGAGIVQLGDAIVGGASASIAGVNEGVLFSSTTNLNFTFGDGEGATDTGSIINATTSIAHDGSGLPANGTYNFQDVDVSVGNFTNITGPTFFVFDQAGTSGAGTFADPGTALEAENAAADVLVMIDSDIDGSSAFIDIVAQGVNAFNLDHGQVLIGLVSGQSIDVGALGASSGGGAPGSFQFTGINSSTVITASGTVDTALPTLYASAGIGVQMDGTGSVASAIIRSNASIGLNMVSNATGNIIFQDLLVLAPTSYAINVAPGGGAQTLSLSDLILQGSNAGGVGDAALRIAAGAGTITEFSDITVSTNSGGIIINSGTIFDADTVAPGAQAVDGGTMSLGSSVSRIAGDGLRLDGVLGSLDFTALNIFNDSGTGLYVRDAAGKGGTFMLTNTGGTINTTNGTAIDIDPVLTDLNFTTVSSTNAGAAGGILLDTVDAVGGAGTNALTITNLSITDSLASGITINNSSGNYTFTNATITDVIGHSISVFGGSSVLNFGSGGAGITHSGSGAAVSVSGGHTGSLTFSDTIAATNGTGLQFDNAQGSQYNFNNNVNLNGGDAGIDIINGTSASFTFSNTSITNPTGTAFNIDGTGGVGVTWSSGSVTQNNAASAIVINNHASGIINLGGTITANTTTANAIDLNNFGTVNFSGTSARTINTTSGTGFEATGGGTISVQGTGNSVTTTTGQVVNFEDVSIGGSDVAFASLQSTGTVSGADGILLDNVDGGIFNGGNVTIVGTSGASTDGIQISGGSSATFNFVSADIDNAANHGINVDGTGNGDITFDTVAIDGAAAGSAILLNNHSGTFTVSGGTIGATNVNNNGVLIAGNSGAVTIAASVTSSSNMSYNIQGRTGGTVSITGNINDTGSGISVNGNTGGTINFSGTSKMLDTGANDAVYLVSNNNTTINFTGGGLDITTVAGAGFLAGINAGTTITVQGTGNRISTSSRAIDIVGTTIGTAGITFESITQGAGVTAISLINTGSSGGFTITGDGGSAVNGSGGLLSNLTGDAIVLDNTMNFSADQLNMSNIAGNGVLGQGVNGFSYTNATLTTIGDADPEDAFNFNRDTTNTIGLYGTALFQNLTITSFYERGIDIVNEANSAASLDLDIVDVSMSNNNDTDGEDAIRVQNESNNSADVLISGGTYDSIESDVLAYFAQSTGTNNVTVTDVTSTNGGGGDNFPNGGGLLISGALQSTTTFDINSNNFTGVQGSVIAIVGTPGSGQSVTMNGSISGNTLTTDLGDSIDLDFDGDPGGASIINTTISILNNIINFEDDGIGVDYRDAAGVANITIQNNIFSAVAGSDGNITNSDDGIFIFTDDDIGAGGASTVNVKIDSNIFDDIQPGNKIIVVEDVRDPGRSACFDITNNFVNSGADEIELDFDITGSGGSITQASTAALSVGNGGATVNVIDQTPSFNGPCVAIPLP